MIILNFSHFKIIIMGAEPVSEAQQLDNFLKKQEGMTIVFAIPLIFIYCLNGNVSLNPV